MDVEELMIIVEKSRKSIQPLEENIFDDLRERIFELEELRKKAEKDEEIQRIEDEFRTLRRIQRKLFEERVGKIIRAAWAEVCGTVSGIDGLENLLSKEKELYRNLVEIISSFRDEFIYGSGSSIDKIGTEDTSTLDSEYLVIRVREDVEFEGIDGKTYKLKKEDVVALPSLNANALLRGGIAEEIEIKR